MTLRLVVLNEEVDMIMHDVNIVVRSIVKSVWSERIVLGLLVGALQKNANFQELKIHYY